MEDSPFIASNRSEVRAADEREKTVKPAPVEMQPVRVLIIEDEEAHFALMKRAIRKELDQARVCHAASAEACLEDLGSIDPDIILVDYLMPGMTGLEFLAGLKQTGSDIPVIMITGQGDEHIAVQAMKLGAQDYLVKSADFFSLLPAVVGQVVRERKLKLHLLKVARLNELLLDSLPYPAMMINRDGLVLAANRIALQQGAMAGENCRQHFRYTASSGPRPTGAMACPYCRLNDAFDLNKAVNSPQVAIDEHYFDMWWIPIDREVCLTYAIDITERRRVEARLRRNEAWFRKVFENAATGIAITDLEGRFKQCNRAFTSLLGYTEAELQGMRLSSIIDPLDRDDNLFRIEQLLTGREPFFEIENRYAHKNGQPIWVHKFVSLLMDESGRPSHMIALVSDITKSKQAKEMLDALNKSLLERTNLAEQRAVYIQQLAMELSKTEERERQRLASILHDDLQQMLAYLKLQLSTLPQDNRNGAQLAGLDKVIGDCIERCRNLSHELRPFSSTRSDFPAALRRLAQRMTRMYGLEVSLQITADPEVRSSVLCSLLIRSIRELLFNTVKHSGAGSASIRVQIEGPQMQIAIKDGGQGCDPGKLKEKRDRNEAFGLFDIEDRIKFLGGRMQIETGHGKGFRVRLRVPRDIACPKN